MFAFINYTLWLLFHLTGGYAYSKLVDEVNK